MFYQIFFSPKWDGVRLFVINMVLRVASKLEGKPQNLIELKPNAQLYSQNENFVNTAKNCWKIEIDISP